MTAPLTSLNGKPVRTGAVRGLRDQDDGGLSGDVQSSIDLSGFNWNTDAAGLYGVWTAQAKVRQRISASQAQVPTSLAGAGGE